MSVAAKVAAMSPDERQARLFELQAKAAGVTDTEAIEVQK